MVAIAREGRARFVSIGRFGTWLGVLAVAAAACGTGDLGSAVPAGDAGAGGSVASSIAASGSGGPGSGGSLNTGGADAATTGASGGTSAEVASSVSASVSSGGGDPVDPCVGASSQCPGAPPSSAGKGLVAIDRCAFPIDDGASWSLGEALVAQLAAKLPATHVEGLLGALNRTAVNVSAAQVPGNAPAIAQSFRWNDGDMSVAYWIPQGISGSADAQPSGLVGGHHVVLVSWYYDKASEPGSSIEKGARIAIVDTSLSPPKYRLALLVEPQPGNPVSFSAVPVHAGGIAWYGDLLYVADTSQGFRVFDLAHVLAVDASKDTIGYDPATKTWGAAKYGYVVPQVARYVHASSCSPRFSFVALDRSSSPPSLVSGEYCDGNAYCSAPYAGRVFRWSLDPVNGRLGSGASYPSEAFFMGEKQVQGAVFRDGKALLSSSAPAAGAGELYVIPPKQPRTKIGWVDSPEDLYQNLATGQLWGLSEAVGERYVFAVKAP